MAIDFEALREAAAIVDGVPAERLDLDTLGDDVGVGGAPQCRTIACALGWIVMHPSSREKGVKMNVNGALSIDGEATGMAAVGAHLFGLRKEETDALFDMRGRQADPSSISDKEVFKHRVRQFFAEHGQRVNPDY